MWWIEHCNGFCAFCDGCAVYSELEYLYEAELGEKYIFHWGGIKNCWDKLEQIWAIKQVLA